MKRASPWLVQEFVYPHAHVELHFFRVFAWDGELASHDGQAFEWQTPGQYTVAPLLLSDAGMPYQKVLLSLALKFKMPCTSTSG